MHFDQVRAFCLEHQLFTPGPVVVAVSGGADSLTLLRLLADLSPDFGLRLHVATLNHSIRGEAGTADAQFVREIAEQWGLPVTVGQVDVPALAQADRGVSLEAAARRARYQFLAEVATAVGASTVALGHNRDDQAETILMHIIRGAGLAGLRGMLPRSPLPIEQTGDQGLVAVRPLLNTSRAEIDAFIHERGLTPREDHTNADVAYTRNFIRHRVVPVLESINPEVRAALARTGELARDDYASLLTHLPDWTKHDHSLSIELKAWAALTSSDQRILLREAVHELHPGVDLAADTLRTFVNASRSKLSVNESIPGTGLHLRIDNESAWIYRGDYPSDCPALNPDSMTGRHDSQPGSMTIPLSGGWQFSLTPKEQDEPPDLSVGPLSALLWVPQGAHVEVRTRWTGDRFKPAGSRGHSQKLSDTLINMKVPEAWRSKIPLVVINEQIAFFIAPLMNGVGRRVAEPFSPTAPRTIGDGGQLSLVLFSES